MNTNADQVTVRENPHLIPLCPHCEKPLTTVDAREIAATGTMTVRFGKRYIYACPTCHKSLGVSHRKGFWMG